MPISGLNRAMVVSAVILGVATGCVNSNREQPGCDAWELALEARESAEGAMAVLEYEAEQLEDWISADSTVEALADLAWELVPRADSAAASAWDEARAALEAVDSTAAESLTAADSVAGRYPDGVSKTAVEAVQEVANAAAAVFEAVGAGCPQGPPRATEPKRETVADLEARLLYALASAAQPRPEAVADSAPDGCVAWAWAVTAQAESALADEALMRARRLSVLVDSVLLATQDTALASAWAAGLDLRGATLRAAIEAGVATRKAEDLVDELVGFGCPVR